MKKSKDLVVSSAKMATMDNIGISSIYIHQKRTQAIKELFSRAYTYQDREDIRNEIKDFIFGKTKYNPLDFIYDEFKRGQADIEKRANKVLNK